MDKVLSVESGAVLVGYGGFVKDCYSQLLNRERECVQLVDLLDSVRIKWKDSEQRRQYAEEKCQRLETENESLKKEYYRLKDRFYDSMSEAEKLKSLNVDLQNRLVDYESRIRNVRSLIEGDLKDSVMFNQLMGQLPQSLEQHLVQQRCISKDLSTVVDFDQDDNDDDFKSQPKTWVQRQSHTLLFRRVEPSLRKRFIECHNDNDFANVSVRPKKSRDFSCDEITTVTKVTMDPRGRQPTRASVEVHRTPKRRSQSESRALDLMATPLSTKARLGLSFSDVRSPCTALGSTWTKGRPILECTHNYEHTKGALMKTCAVCNRTVTMQNVVKCKDCNLYIHHGCRAKAPMPCIPFQKKLQRNTPQKPSRAPRLADLCPKSAPLVPAQLISLVYEIEKRIGTEGLYRIPGSKEKVDRLLNVMTTSVIPQLQEESTEVLTSALKKFIGNLREPLIPATSYDEFLQAASLPDDRELIEAIDDLPYPNRDTLAFLFVHLLKVASAAETNKMTRHNLAVCLGCTVVRGLRRVNAVERDVSAEAGHMIKLMRRLMDLDEDYWNSYLESRTLTAVSQPKSALRASRLETPRNADQSMLGPVVDTPPPFTPTLRSVKRRQLSSVRDYN